MLAKRSGIYLMCIAAIAVAFVASLYVDYLTRHRALAVPINAAIVPKWIGCDLPTCDGMYLKSNGTFAKAPASKAVVGHGESLPLWATVDANERRCYVRDEQVGDYKCWNEVTNKPRDGLVIFNDPPFHCANGTKLESDGVCRVPPEPPPITAGTGSISTVGVTIGAPSSGCKLGDTVCFSHCPEGFEPYGDGGCKLSHPITGATKDAALIVTGQSTANAMLVVGGKASSGDTLSLPMIADQGLIVGDPVGGPQGPHTVNVAPGQKMYVNGELAMTEKEWLAKRDEEMRKSLASAAHISVVPPDCNDPSTHIQALAVYGNNNDLIVSIDQCTGKVTIGHPERLDKDAKAFWRAIQNAFPQMCAAKVDAPKSCGLAMTEKEWRAKDKADVETTIDSKNEQLPAFAELCVKLGVLTSKCHGSFAFNGENQTDPSLWYSGTSSVPDDMGIGDDCYKPVPLEHYRIYNGKRGTTYACLAKPEDDRITPDELAAIALYAQRANSLSKKTLRNHQEALEVKRIIAYMASRP